jgi:hypothetical protein
MAGRDTIECPDCGYDELNCRCAEDLMDEWDCTHCGGEGVCEDGADPLVTCPCEPHNCHACGGSGLRRDQRIF